MAVPKRKKSKSKRNKRRTHQRVEGANLSACPQCGEVVLSHHACSSCGTYKGRSVIDIEQ
jgi:large subunit ribosomal protein L32